MTINEKLDDLELKKGLNIKFTIFFFVLFIIFWFIYYGRLSKYFSLVCALMFLCIAVFYFINLLINLKLIAEQLKK